MSAEGGYGDTGLRAAFGALRDVRQRLADLPGRVAITPAAFGAALRSRYPDFPELPEGLESADSPSDLPWPDSCGQWLDIALSCYSAALADEQGGHTEQATFHWAEGDYCVAQARHCLGMS